MTCSPFGPLSQFSEHILAQGLSTGFREAGSRVATSGTVGVMGRGSPHIWQEGQPLLRGASENHIGKTARSDLHKRKQKAPRPPPKHTGLDRMLILPTLSKRMCASHVQMCRASIPFDVCFLHEQTEHIHSLHDFMAFIWILKDNEYPALHLPDGEARRVHPSPSFPLETFPVLMQHEEGVGMGP